MGSRGLVSFNQRIVFIEGEEASADREVYERLFPPSEHHISFVPAGNSATVRKTAERVNELLSTSLTFQHYYSIVDGDIERFVDAPAKGGERLFVLPVYHVENFLLSSSHILRSVQSILGSQCPFDSADDIDRELKEILLSPAHLRPFARSLLDATLARLAKVAWDSVFRAVPIPSMEQVPTYDQMLTEAEKVMQQAIESGTWESARPR